MGSVSSSSKAPPASTTSLATGQPVQSGSRSSLPKTKVTTGLEELFAFSATVTSVPGPLPPHHAQPSKEIEESSFSSFPPVCTILFIACRLLFRISLFKEGHSGEYLDPGLVNDAMWSECVP